MVSVLIMTYNHQAYIRQAIDSALAQRLSVCSEILISEDCSTDGTDQIVRQYAERYRNSIRPLMSVKNIRTNEVVSRGIHAARGKYVALLDGDDYWTDENKLQLQVEFMEQHPECTICFHNMHVVDGLSHYQGRDWNRPEQREISQLTDLVRGNYLATSSVMYRRSVLPQIPPWYHDFFPVTDWPLHILFAEHGSMGYIQRVMGAYRLHAAGWYSPGTPLQKLRANAEFYARMRRHVSEPTQHLLNAGQFDYFREWVEEYTRQADSAMAYECLKFAWQSRPYRRVSAWPRLAKLAFQIASIRCRGAQP